MKIQRATNCLFALLIVSLTGCGSSGSSSSSEPDTLGVGSTGPGGGTVFAFFDDTNTSGLEMFPAVIGEAAWGCEGVVVDAVSVNGPSNGVGAPSGTVSSEIIRTANTTGICFAAAAQLTFEFTNNGFNDWYLPSTDELVSIRDLGLLPGGQGDAFWSSTEDTQLNAFTVIIQNEANVLDNGEPSTTDKSVVTNVVAIRTF